MFFDTAFFDTTRVDAEGPGDKMADMPLYIGGSAIMIRPS
jgi:hypothetical protein